MLKAPHLPHGFGGRYVCPAMSKKTTPPPPKTPIDALTGLPLRAAFDAWWPQVTAHATKSSASAAIAVFDLDRFGLLNDTHGTAFGDAAIASIAGLITAAGNSKHAFRFGGDAIALVWPDLEKEQAFLCAEACRQAVDAPRTVGGVSCHITVSAGVAACPDDGEDPETLVHKASEALYRAKVTGQNKTCLAREEKMVTKTSHYTQGQLMGLRRLAERDKINEAQLLREALNDLLRKRNA